MSALGVVVPVFDEAGRIDDFVDRLVAFVDGQPPGSRLVFVDDGSGDGTADLLAARTSGHDRVAVLRRPHEGKGAAVAAGIRSLDTPYVAFCDLDLSTPLEGLDAVVDAARRADLLAIASRDLATSRLVRPEGRVREALGRGYNRLLQATVTPGVVDTQCGAKAAARSVWERLLPWCEETGFAWDAEVVAVAMAVGVPVAEVPVAWRHDDRSKIRVGRDGAAMVRATTRILASARRARRAAAAAPAQPGDGGWLAELGREHDRHWWFRSKAALVATALRRTDGPSGVLVDVGAGAGGVTARLGWDPGHAAVLELDAGLAGIARRRHGLPSARSTATELPVADGTAAVICLLDVVEHLDDPDAAVAEAARSLRPGGRLVVTVPAYQWLWSGADETLGHVRRYDRRALLDLVGRHGLEPVVDTFAFSYLLPPVLLVRLLLRRGQEETGLDQGGVLVDRAALVLTSIERRLIGRVRIPFGTSILCVATKP